MGKYGYAVSGRDRYCRNCGRGYSASVYTCPRCNMPTVSLNQPQAPIRYAHPRSISPNVKRILTICAIFLAVFIVSSVWNHANFNRLSEAIGAGPVITKTNLRTQTVGNWEINVTGYEFTKIITSGVNRYFDAGAGNTFLLVYLDAKNGGKARETFLPASFTTSDLSCEVTLSKGSSSESYGVTRLIGYADDMIDKSVSSQMTASGAIAFVLSGDLKSPDKIKLIFSQDDADVAFNLK